MVATGCPVWLYESLTPPLVDAGGVLVVFRCWCRAPVRIASHVFVGECGGVRVGCCWWWRLAGVPTPLGVPTLPGLFCSPVIDYRKHVLLREVIADLMQSDDQLVLYLVAPPPHTGSRYPPRLLKCSGAFYIASCIG